MGFKDNICVIVGCIGIVMIVIGVFSWNLVLLISGMILGTALNYYVRSKS